MRPETYGALKLVFKNLESSRSYGNRRYKTKKIAKAQKHLARAQKYEGRDFDILGKWNKNFWNKPRFEEYINAL